MWRADPDAGPVESLASPRPAAATPTWSVDIDWLEPDIALLYSCADMRRFLVAAGQARITGGARLRIARQPAITVLFWRGTPAELGIVAPVPPAPLLAVSDGVIGCDGHGVVLVCVAQTHLLNLVRGQRTTLEVPGGGPADTTDPVRALTSTLRALVVVNQWFPGSDMRQGFGRRLLRECLSARVRQMLAHPVLLARAPLLVKLLLSRAALEDLSGIFADCAAQALAISGAEDGAVDDEAA